MEQKQSSDVVQIMGSSGRLQSGEKTVHELLAEYPCPGRPSGYGHYGSRTWKERWGREMWDE